MEIFRKLGDKSYIGLALIYLGDIARQQGDYERAAALYEKSLALYREIGSKWGIALPLQNLGKIAFARGDYARARALFEQSLPLYRESGNIPYAAVCLVGLAAVARIQGQPERAAQLLGAAQALLDRTSSILEPLDREAMENEITAVRAQLGDEKNDHAERFMHAAAAWRERANRPWGEDMRPVEILLSLANLFAFVVLVVPLPAGLGWMRHFALVPLPIMGAQLLVEGPRWQMIPAYILSGVFFLVWLLQSLQARGGAGEGWTYWLVVALGVLGLGISIGLPIILPVFQFPHPTGQYEVGTLTYHWVDNNRPEVLSKDPHAHRELMVQVWYPAKANASGQRAPYMQDTDALAPALARLLHVPEFTFGYMKYLVGYLKYVKTNAIPSAPITDAEPRFPVLIFLEGFTGIRQQDTFQVEELVSHGYIVAGIDQPYAAATVVFPDGRQVPVEPRMIDLIWQSVSPHEKAPELNGQSFEDGIIPYLAQDAIFALDQLVAVNQADPNGILTGRLDLERVGIFGDSLGGIVVGEACLREPRFRACLVEDAPLTADVARAGLQQPTMWISRDVQTMEREGWSQRDIDETQNTMRAVFQSLKADGYLVLVPGMFHLNMVDTPYYSPLTSLLGVTGPIDAKRAHNIIKAYSLAFFDRYLKNLPEPLLDGPSAQYSEVLLERHRS